MLGGGFELGVPEVVGVDEPVGWAGPGSEVVVVEEVLCPRPPP